MPNPQQTTTRAIAWIGGAMLFLMAIAAWSRISQMKETGKTIDAGSSAIVNLFKGVFK